MKDVPIVVLHHKDNECLSIYRPIKSQDDFVFEKLPKPVCHAYLNTLSVTPRRHARNNTPQEYADEDIFS